MGAATFAAAALAALLWSGCGVLRGVPEGDLGDLQATAAAPAWRLDAFNEHLSFLQRALAGGSEAGHEEAAQYVATRMHDYRLQPVFKESYLLPSGAGAEKPFGVAGYVSGKRPVLERELVIVCAGWAGEEEGEPPLGAAALLELARNYAYFGRFSLVPERTMLFAVWAEGPEGLAAYLRAPTWPLANVHALVYVGLGAEEKAEAAALLDPLGIPLYAVAPEELPYPLPEPGAAPRGGGSPPALRARATAAKAHSWLRAEVLSAGALLPALGDTLRVPPAAEEER